MVIVGLNAKDTVTRTKGMIVICKIMVGNTLIGKGKGKGEGEGEGEKIIIYQGVVYLLIVLGTLHLLSLYLQKDYD